MILHLKFDKEKKYNYTFVLSGKEYQVLIIELY